MFKILVLDMFLSSPLQERRGRPVLEKHAPKTAEEIEKLSENILTNPVTEDDVKNNEYWDKVVRYERALADLAMGSTLRKAADKYQLNKGSHQSKRDKFPVNTSVFFHSS